MTSTAARSSKPRAARRRDNDTRSDARERILSAGEAALIANGGAFEMAEVAARAAASAGLAYHYFGSKSGLVSAVISAFFDRYDTVINMRMDGSESWARRERRRLDALIDFLFRDPFAPVVLGKLSRSPETLEVEAERWRALHALSAKNIANGQKSGAIAADVDPQIAGAAILGGVREACALALLQEPRPDPRTLADNLWNFIAGAVRLKEQQE